MRGIKLRTISGGLRSGWLLSVLLASASLGCGSPESPSSSQGGAAGLSAAPDQGGEPAEGGAAAGPSGGSAATAGSSTSGSASGGGGRAAACEQAGGEVGSCKALFHAWFFDKMRGACMPYVYGGCGASENHFESQMECEGACGGALYSTCPAAPSDGSCDGRVTACRYTPEGCACLQTSPASFNCVPADAECGEPSEYPTSCTCASGSWHCAARPMP
jgi:hypothetical protein